MCSPWVKFARDMNGDGLFTISDVWAWGKYSFYYPGDQAAVFILSFKGFSQFFELTPALCRGWLSLFISLLFWIIAYRLLDLVYGPDVPKQS